MDHLRFLAIEEVLLMHNYQVNQFGGMHGVRDKNLLESAVNMPQVTFADEYLCKDVFEMAATYAHGIIKNHPLCDGNKRTGMAAALIFLENNELQTSFSNNMIFKIAIAIATSEIKIPEIAQIFKKHTTKMSRYDKK